jgi:hypothetical protein
MKKDPFKDCFNKLKEHDRIKFVKTEIQQDDFRVGSTKEKVIEIPISALNDFIRLSFEESVRQVEKHPIWRFFVILAICMGLVSSITGLITYIKLF